jgi:hypothetical protein
MPRVAVTAEEEEFIRARIEHFAVEAPENLHWQLPFVQRHNALPLYVGWTETAGIQPDGTLVRWSTEEAWPGVQELKVKTWVNVALVEGSKRYPVLQRLIPPRPDAARTCAACNGLGGFPQMPEIICECGGVGWIAG